MIYTQIAEKFCSKNEEVANRIYNEIIDVDDFEKNPLGYLKEHCLYWRERENIVARYIELDIARTGDEYDKELGCFVDRSGNEELEFQEFISYMQGDINEYLDYTDRFIYNEKIKESVLELDEEEREFTDKIVGDDMYIKTTLMRNMVSDIILDKVKKQLEQIAKEYYKNQDCKAMTDSEISEDIDSFINSFESDIAGNTSQIQTNDEPEI